MDSSAQPPPKSHHDNDNENLHWWTSKLHKNSHALNAYLQTCFSESVEVIRKSLVAEDDWSTILKWLKPVDELLNTLQHTSHDVDEDNNNNNQDAAMDSTASSSTTDDVMAKMDKIVPEFDENDKVCGNSQRQAAMRGVFDMLRIVKHNSTDDRPPSADPDVVVGIILWFWFKHRDRYKHLGTGLHGLNSFFRHFLANSSRSDPNCDFSRKNKSPPTLIPEFGNFDNEKPSRQTFASLQRIVISVNSSIEKSRSPSFQRFINLPVARVLQEMSKGLFSNGTGKDDDDGQAAFDTCIEKIRVAAAAANRHQVPDHHSSSSSSSSSFMNLAPPPTLTIELPRLDGEYGGRFTTISAEYPLGDLIRCWFEDEEINQTNFGLKFRGLSEFLRHCTARDNFVFPVSLDSRLTRHQSSVYSNLERKYLECEQRKTIFQFSKKISAKGDFKPHDFFDDQIKNVLSTQASENTVNGRHVPCLKLNPNKPLTDACDTVWRSQPAKVVVLGGSSGSGKTVASIQVARCFSEDDVVIYLTPTDLIVPGGEVNSWTRNGRFVIEELHDQYQLQKREKQKQQDHQSNVSNNTTTLDDDAAPPSCVSSNPRDEYFMACVKSTINKYLPLWLIKPDRSGDSNNNQYRVVIVFDEIGGDRVFVKALRSCAVKMAQLLHEKFFGENSVPAKKLRVSFVVSGTGLAIPENSAADPDATARSFLLDEQYPLKLDFPSMTCFISPDLVSHTSPEIVQLKSLQANFDKNPQSLSSTQLLVLDLCKNARCAAMLFVRLNEWFCSGRSSRSDDKTTWYRTENLVRSSRSSGFFDVVLSGLLPQIIQEYVNRNALNRFERPESALLTALAAVTFRLPAFPQTLHKCPLLVKELKPRFYRRPGGTELENEKEVMNSSLFDLLVVKAGVLVDVLADDDENDGENNNNENNVVINNKPKSRFKLFDAHLAMIHVIFCAERQPCGSAGFKKSTVNFCYLTTLMSPFFVEMKNALLRDRLGYKEETAAPTSGGGVLAQLKRVEEVMMNVKKQNSADDDDDAGNNNSNNSNNMTEDNKTLIKLWKKLIDDDPLYSFKEKLVFPPSLRRRWSGAWMLNDVYKCSMKAPVVTASEGFDAKLKEIENYSSSASASSPSFFPFRSASESAASSPLNVLVMLSADKESFADIVVIGPGKVVLIQCKGCESSDSVKGISVHDELEKMVVEVVPERENEQQPTSEETARKLEVQDVEKERRRQYLDCLIKLAKKNTDSSSSSVTVERVLVLAVNSDLLEQEAVEKGEEFKTTGEVNRSLVDEGSFTAACCLASAESSRFINFFPSYDFFQCASPSVLNVENLFRQE